MIASLLGLIKNPLALIDVRFFNFYQGVGVGESSDGFRPEIEWDKDLPNRVTHTTQQQPEVPRDRARFHRPGRCGDKLSIHSLSP